MTFLSENSVRTSGKRGIAQPADQALPQEFLAMLAQLDRLHASMEDKGGAAR